MELTQKEFCALVSLLDDRDGRVTEHVENKLLAYGTVVIQKLRNVSENFENPVIQRRIDEIIHRINLDGLRKEILDWTIFGAKDLFRGAMLVVRYEYENVNEKKYREQIERIVKNILPSFKAGETLKSRIEKIASALFYLEKFKGNQENYDEPENNYINKILERKTGNPIGLSLMFLLICEKLKLPVQGMNLPSHFILTFSDGGKDYYLDAFNRGAIFDKNEVEKFLKRLHVETDESVYHPCNNIVIVRRLLNNLIHAYEERGQIRKVEELESLRVILSNEQ